jgi:hypothetical protein
MDTQALKATHYGVLFLCVALLLSITWFFPYYFKTWFVEETGSVRIAPFLGVLLSILLLFRTHWAWRSTVVFAWLLLVLTVSSIFLMPNRPGFYLVAALSVILVFLLRSRYMKQFFPN